MTSIDSREPTFEDLKLLTEVSQLLTLLDLDSVMQQVISLMSSAVGATKASLFLQDEDDIDWEHIFLTRDLAPDQSITVVRTVLNDGLAGWVMRNKQGSIVYDTHTDARWHLFPDDSTAARSALCVPFMHDERVLAVLTLVHTEPDHFNDHHLYLMTIVANQAAVALRNAQLFNEIQSQQRQLEIVLHAIPDILVVLNDEGKVLMVNDSATKFLGSNSRGGVVGKKLDDFDFEKALNPAQRIISKSTLSGDYWAFEARSENTEQDFLVTMSRWINPANHNSGFIVVMHDVTTLRDLHRFKDEMLRIVSHDLRNPVSLVITARDMLEMDMPELPENSDIPQYMSIIKQATERMDTMLDDLLRTETSSRMNINPNELIDNVLKDLKPMAQRKKQTLQAELDLDDVTNFVVDPMLIREAMDNYVSNAIKYTGERGHILIRAFMQDQRFYFQVEDNGIGIATEHLNHLFEPYYRIDRPETYQEEGYGVGLNLVKTIIERHKGEVWVTSTEGEGSCFGFWLPM